MKKLFAILALMLTFPSHAATYYVSDCRPGAVAGCVPGSDTSLTPTKKATPLRTIAKAFAIFRTARPGDKILFAKGGSFDNTGEPGIQNLDSIASNPIVFGSYAPAWYSGSKKPILNQIGDGGIFGFTDGGSPEADGGYVVRDLHLKSAPGFFNSAFFTSQLTGDILLENLTIEGFNIGVYCGTNIPRVTLRNSKLLNNAGAGILWSCDHSVVENNTFDNNGYGDMTRDHQIYLDSSPVPVKDVTIRNNSFKNSVHFEGPACTGVVIVAHGRFEGVLIENNRIVETTPARGGCWGIAFDSGKGFDEGGAEYFKDVIIRGNLLVNVGNTGIGGQSLQNAIIENNVLIWQTPLDDARAIAVPDKRFNPDSEDLATTNVTIRNNSIYFKQVGAWTVGVQVSDEGSNHIISSNLIYFGSTPNETAYCFSTHDLAIDAFKDINNNLCYLKGGARFNEAFADLNAAQAADHRWNASGLTKNPSLLKTPGPGNDWTMALKSESPAINAGDSATCSTTSFGGETRNSRCDIGAYEYVAP